MPWSEDPGLSFVSSESLQDAAAAEALQRKAMPRERSLDIGRGEAAVFIHCSLSSALGVPSGI